MDFQKLTLEQIENHLGQAGKKSGNQYIWQCPYCMDKSRNNLTFNPSKGVLWCFASDGEHSKIIVKEIRSKNNKDKPYHHKPKNYSKTVQDKPKVDVFGKEKQDELITYMLECNDALLNHDKSLNYLETKRGLNKDTVSACGIGIDLKSRKWVIPTFKYDLKENFITGFEFRPSDFGQKKFSRTKDTPTSMAMINHFTSTTELLAIVEGYFDGYALYQHLSELEQIKYYHIVTPSNGVSSLLKYVHEIRFDAYKHCYLYIDNDDAGNKAAFAILERYPFFERISMNCGCKDFNEHYIKCIKNSPLQISQV